MASTSITTAGGMVVVTQVIPKDENSIPLQTPAEVPQKPPPPVKKTPAKVDNMTTAFLRGEPLALGIVQICIGLMCVVFSLSAFYSPAMLVAAPFGFTVAFVVSGSLAVAARKGTSVKLVWASLLSHVVSVLLGLAGSAYLCWLMAVGLVQQLICYPLGYWNGLDLDDPAGARRKCLSKIWFLDRVLFGLFGLLLVLLVLQVCVAITVCVFSGKAIRRHRHYSLIKVGADDCGGLLDSDVEDVCRQSS